MAIKFERKVKSERKKRPESRAVEYTGAHREKVRNLTEQMVGHYRRMDIFLTLDGRVNPTAFRKYYAREKLENDDRAVTKSSNGIAEDRLGISRTDAVNENISSDFEQLVPILFTKVFGEKIAAFRASRYDDLKNGVDNILLDRETGDVVCAIDEIVISSSHTVETYRKKKEKVRKRSAVGVKIDYGYQIGPDGTAVPESRYADCPLLCLGIKRDDFLKVISRVSDSFTDSSTYDKMVCSVFLRQMIAQLKECAGEFIREEKEAKDEYALMALKLSRKRSFGMNEKEKTQRLLKMFTELFNDLHAQIKSDREASS